MCLEVTVKELELRIVKLELELLKLKQPQATPKKEDPQPYVPNWPEIYPKKWYDDKDWSIPADDIKVTFDGFKMSPQDFNADPRVPPGSFDAKLDAAANFLKMTRARDNPPAVKTDDPDVGIFGVTPIPTPEETAAAPPPFELVEPPPEHIQKWNEAAKKIAGDRVFYNEVNTGACCAPGGPCYEANQKINNEPTTTHEVERLKELASALDDAEQE